MAILCGNPLALDPRVRRHASTLAEHGFDVDYLAPAPGNDTAAEQLAPRLSYHAVAVPRRCHGPRLEALARRWQVADELASLWPALFDPAARLEIRLYDQLETTSASLTQRTVRVVARRAVTLAAQIYMRSGLGAWRRRPALAGVSARAVSDLEFDRRVAGQLVGMGLHLADAVAKLAPDVVFCIDAPMLPAGVALGRKLGVPVIVDMHEVFHAQVPVGSRSPAWTDFWHGVQRHYLPQTSQRITVCDAMGVYFAEMGTGAWVTLLNAPALRIPARARARRAPHQPFRVSYHGFVYEHRGLETLLEASARLSTAVVRIRGSGPLVSTLVAKIAQGKARAEILPAVPYEDLLTTLAEEDASVLAFPDTCLNLRFVLPNKFYEALMAGLPLLVAPRVELARYVREYDLGMVLDDESPAGIAAGIEKLATNVERWRTWRANALRTAQERFNWEAESPKLVATVRQALAV